MLYIMRHGRTDWKDAHRIQGRTDIPLNDEGRQMARDAAEEYKDLHLDICYCSPMIRAKETAQILLSGRDVPIVYDERLIEMGFGIYEGIKDSFQIPDCPINEFFFHPEAYTTPVHWAWRFPFSLAVTFAAGYAASCLLPRPRRRGPPVSR